MSDDIAIKVENLSKSYEIYNHPSDRLKQFFCRNAKRHYTEFWALKNVSFDIKKGETVGIVGKNGSGKSTLLQAICGTLNPTTGNIQAKGRIAALLELGSGFNPEFTGRENVYMNGAVIGLTQSQIDAKFDDILAFSEIGDFIEQPLKTYSTGMVMRLAFSVAVSADPEILVIDEALSVGDEFFQRKCYSRIEEIRSNGATILFVSHSANQVVQLCNRAILIDGGEKIKEGEPKEIVTLYQKLLYSRPEKREELRNEIINTNYVVQTSVSSDTQSAFKEVYDPGIDSLSPTEYESRGAVISTPKILTLEGNKANGLIRGRRYRYCYKVLFDQAANDIRFGMSIKSINGFHLAGCVSSPSLRRSLINAKKGMQVDVEFLFDCNLNPGMYFMNSGVFGFTGDEEIILHRLVDILAFKVLPIEANLETEVLSLRFEPSIKVYE